MKVYLENTSKIYVDINKHSEYKDVVKGFNLLGYEVVRITFPYALYLYIDTPFYKKYNDKLLNKMYKCLASGIEIGTITYNSGRFYIIIDNTKIILPDDMHNVLKCDTLSICLELKQKN